MRMSGRQGWLGAALGCALAIAAADGARAHSCGDPDDSGVVDVIDAANVLRAAVDLASTCSGAEAVFCDVDGDGNITVIDAANVLRRAVSLPGANACPDDGGEEEIAQATASVLPFLTAGVGLFPEVTPGFTAHAALDVDDCPQGGQRIQDDDNVLSTGAITVTLVSCQVQNQLGTFRFNGDVIAFVFGPQAGTIDITLTVTDVANSTQVSFDGEIDAVPAGGGGFVADGGPVVLTTPQGEFELTFDQLRIDGDGNLVSGSGTIADSDDNFATLDAVTVTALGGNTATLLAELDDGDERTFTLDLDTGALTPAS
jgi:hypothetical protein